MWSRTGHGDWSYGARDILQLTIELGSVSKSLCYQNRYRTWHRWMIRVINPQEKPTSSCPSSPGCWTGPVQAAQAATTSSIINNGSKPWSKHSSIIKHFTNHHRSTRHWWKRCQNHHGSQHLFQRWRVKVDRTGATGIMFIEWDAKSMRLVVYCGLLWFRGWSPPNLVTRNARVESCNDSQSVWIYKGVIAPPWNSKIRRFQQRHTTPTLHTTCIILIILYNYNVVLHS